ncbi:unnamed protein product [Pedinophyceae sp. YPF-701]|nr:unnamed protein product [Pedinophyceae sp. YPF-701]
MPVSVADYIAKCSRAGVKPLDSFTAALLGRTSSCHITGPGALCSPEESREAARSLTVVAEVLPSCEFSAVRVEGIAVEAAVLLKLVSAVASCPSTTTVGLTRCLAEGAGGLASALQPLADCAHLEELTLAECDIDDATATSVVANGSLLRGRSALKTLDLSGNMISQSGAQSIVRRLMSEGALRLTGFALAKLDLRGNPLGPDGEAACKKLAQVVKRTAVFFGDDGTPAAGWAQQPAPCATPPAPALSSASRIPRPTPTATPAASTAAGASAQPPAPPASDANTAPRRPAALAHAGGSLVNRLVQMDDFDLGTPQGDANKSGLLGDDPDNSAYLVPFVPSPTRVEAVCGKPGAASEVSLKATWWPQQQPALPSPVGFPGQSDGDAESGPGLLGADGAGSGLGVASEDAGNGEPERRESAGAAPVEAAPEVPPALSPAVDTPAEGAVGRSFQGDEAGLEVVEALSPPAASTPSRSNCTAEKQGGSRGTPPPVVSVPSARQSPGELEIIPTPRSASPPPVVDAPSSSGARPDNRHVILNTPGGPAALAGDAPTPESAIALLRQQIKQLRDAATPDPAVVARAARGDVSPAGAPAAFELPDGLPSLEVKVDRAAVALVSADRASSGGRSSKRSFDAVESPVAPLSSGSRSAGGRSARPSDGSEMPRKAMRFETSQDGTAHDPVADSEVAARATPSCSLASPEVCQSPPVAAAAAQDASSPQQQAASPRGKAPKTQVLHERTNSGIDTFPSPKAEARGVNLYSDEYLDRLMSDDQRAFAGRGGGLRNSLGSAGQPRPKATPSRLPKPKLRPEDKHWLEWDGKV